MFVWGTGDRDGDRPRREHGAKGERGRERTHSDAGEWKKMFNACVTPTPFVFSMTPSATSGNAAQLRAHAREPVFQATGSPEFKQRATHLSMR